jgi:hypothetical protein
MKVEGNCRSQPQQIQKQINKDEGQFVVVIVGKRPSLIRHFGQSWWRATVSVKIDGWMGTMGLTAVIMQVDL